MSTVSFVFQLPRLTIKAVVYAGVFQTVRTQLSGTVKDLTSTTSTKSASFSASNTPSRSWTSTASLSSTVRQRVHVCFVYVLHPHCPLSYGLRPYPRDLLLVLFVLFVSGRVVVCLCAYCFTTSRCNDVCLFVCLFVCVCLLYSFSAHAKISLATAVQYPTPTVYVTSKLPSLRLFVVLRYSTRYISSTLPRQLVQLQVSLRALSLVWLHSFTRRRR